MVADRLNDAMKQLAHEDSHIRLGGILGLEQIAESQEENRGKIARILVAFIRERDKKHSIEEPWSENESDHAHRNAFIVHRSCRLDVEAAVNALARIAGKIQYGEQCDERKFNLCDLRGADLRGLRFVEANLSAFNLGHSDLRGAWLRGAVLSGACLKYADCGGAFFSDADFKDAKGVTQEQLDQAFADEDAPPRNLPDGLKPPPPPPERSA